MGRSEMPKRAITGHIDRLAELTQNLIPVGSYARSKRCIGTPDNSEEHLSHESV